MTAEFKNELQNLIEKTAKKTANEHFPPIHPSWEGAENQIFDMGFSYGCNFLMPLIEMSVKQTEFYIREYHKVYYGIKSEEKLVKEHISDCRDVLLEKIKDEK